ncbi:MAG: DUF1294 domain-containing protein [Lachnospiraceae bacterium]|nr:DUF1294 domain-containing protein [Lachnospiraceae bacterium]
MPSPLLILLIAYLVIMNIAGFATMGVDKARARKGAWRIPEATLFLVAILGGSIGSIFGMQHFRHKTKHWYFAVGMPVIFFLQLALAIFIITKF